MTRPSGPAPTPRSSAPAGNAKLTGPETARSDEARWTSAATSPTVPNTISTPITTTKALSARTDTSATRHEIRATAEQAGARLDRFLADALGSLSRSRVKALIEQGHASRDGAPTTDPAETIRAGASYALDIPAPAAATPQAQAMPLEILYEDADLIVLDKPAGLVVHPAPGNPDGTLVNAILAHAGEELTGIGDEKRPGIVHRLDKDTSGVMVVAKTARAHQALSEAFAARDLEREYLALVWGVPAPTAGEIEAPIGRHLTDRKRMAVVARGKPALTRYRVERAFGTAASLLRLRLATGRTHQIRVHCMQIGHPVIGDPLYLRRVPAASRALPEPLRAALLGFPRQALHAASLGFRHPADRREMAFASVVPEDFQRLIQLLDSNAK
jgi:23S rRNA pseudouridine1911/1915/1917 synthase